MMGNRNGFFPAGASGDRELALEVAVDRHGPRLDEFLMDTSVRFLLAGLPCLLLPSGNGCLLE